MSKETPETEVPALEQTSLADIKAKLKVKADGELIQLPVSEMVFRLGKPSISKLLKSDAIPADLVIAAIKLDSNSFEPANKKEYLNSLAVIDKIVCESGIAPKIVMKESEVDDSSIWIEDLDDQDRIAIYLFAQTGVKPEIKSFRGDKPDGDAGSDLPEVPGKIT